MKYLLFLLYTLVASGDIALTEDADQPMLPDKRQLLGTLETIILTVGIEKGVEELFHLFKNLAFHHCTEANSDSESMSSSSMSVQFDSLAQSIDSQIYRKGYRQGKHLRSNIDQS